jgi:ATP-dependent Clp protease adaptor protein ClpS
MKKNELHNNWTDELAVLPAREAPADMQVMLHNDDFTPMEFVLKVLKTIFFLEEKSAREVMLQAHNEGKAMIGWFTHEVAETKVDHANRYAREEEHPLMCSMEAYT